MSPCMYDFPFILFLFWCQQHYSSAWRIPSGTSAEMSILWNCLINLSHHMLRVVWRRRWRQTLMYYWEIKVDIQWPRNSRQIFVRLLLNITSVSFIISICTILDTSNISFPKTAHPGDQIFELEKKNDKKITWVQNLMLKIHKQQRVWWGQNFVQRI